MKAEILSSDPVTSTMTESQVQFIHTAREAGVSVRDIAKYLGIENEAALQNYITWGDLSSRIDDAITAHMTLGDRVRDLTDGQQDFIRTTLEAGVSVSDIAK